jgi:hypothetical protein
MTEKTVPAMITAEARTKYRPNKSVADPVCEFVLMVITLLKAWMVAEGPMKFAGSMKGNCGG